MAQETLAVIARIALVVKLAHAGILCQRSIARFSLSVLGSVSETLLCSLNNVIFTTEKNGQKL